MDALVTIVLSALLGAGVTTGTAWFRQHYGARMAARLIYAELTRNSAPIIYYREMHAWSANPVTDTAWNTYGKDLARGREADEFDTVYRGYSAFPALAYVQEHADIAGRDELFDREVEHVIRALHAVGRRARIREEKIAERITRMQPNEAGQSNGVPLAASLMPPALLESVAAYGTKPQQSSAQSTIAVSTQPGGLHRVVLTAHGTEDLDAATVVRREGEVPSGDAAVDEVYDAMGATARFYSDVYGGELESPGSALTAVVHFGEAFLNCFW